MFGSSPLSRGILDSCPSPSHRYRIIPALAGNTTLGSHVGHQSRDHPRSRGEYHAGGSCQPIRRGSSPLSRGIRGDLRGCRSAFGIIPALAGNTVFSAQAWARASDHPRSRGEYKVLESAVKDGRGSSPLSRGILLIMIARGGMLGIIPALAGNTVSLDVIRKCPRDHPRSRGEYKTVLISKSPATGSSPLSRGIL